MSFLELGKLRKMYELGNPMSTQFKVSLFWQKLLSLFFRLRVKIHLPLFLKMLLHLFHRHKEKGPLVALLLGNWFLLTFFFFKCLFLLYNSSKLLHIHFLFCVALQGNWKKLHFGITCPGCQVSSRSKEVLWCSDKPWTETTAEEMILVSWSSLPCLSRNCPTIHFLNPLQPDKELLVVSVGIALLCYNGPLPKNSKLATQHQCN